MRRKEAADMMLHAGGYLGKQVALDTRDVEATFGTATFVNIQKNDE